MNEPNAQNGTAPASDADPDAAAIATLLEHARQLHECSKHLWQISYPLGELIDRSRDAAEPKR